ncbi:MAG: oligosaccharide flippase family protein [bacterium]
MSKLKILTNTGIYTIALILPLVAGFFLLPLYTRYLTPAEYAVIGLVSSFTAIVGIFIALQLQSGIARYVLQFIAKGEKQKAREFLSTVILIMIAMMIASFLLLELFGNQLVSFVYPNSGLTYQPYFRLSLITVVLIALYQAPTAIFKVMQMAKHFFVLNVVVLLATILLSVYLVVYKQVGMLGFFWANLLAALIGCLVAFWLIRDWFCRRFVWGFVPLALAYSLPLIPHSLGTFMFTGANQIILEKFVPLSDIGLFSLASRIASVPLLLVGCFNMAYNPYFIESAEKNENKAIAINADIIGYWYVAVLAMVLGFILFSSLILKVMASQAYYAASGVAGILVFSSIFRGLYMFAVSPLFFKKHTYLIPIITLIAGGTSVALNIFAIPKWGILGAAWVTVFAYLLTFIIAEMVSVKILRIIYPWKKITLVSLLGIGILVVTKLVFLAFPVSLLLSWIISAFALVVYSVIGLGLTDFVVLKRVLNQAFRRPLNRFSLAIEEEEMMDEIEGRIS